jgi:hypothetical protein
MTTTIEQMAALCHRLMCDERMTTEESGLLGDIGDMLTHTSDEHLPHVVQKDPARLTVGVNDEDEIEVHMTEASALAVTLLRFARAAGR